MFAVVCGAIVLASVAPNGLAQDAVAISAGHNVLKEVNHRPALAVGAAVGALSFNDLEGKAYYLDDLCQKGPAVFVFLSTECPVAKRYTLRLARLHGSLAGKGVSIIGIHSNADETREAITAHAAKMGYPFPIVKDAHGYLARRFGATMTPQVFVVDGNGVLRYRGAIDDNRYDNRVKKHYLADVLTALVAGRPAPLARTSARGCTIHLPRLDEVKEVTYTEHVVRILQDNCQGCHRKGQVAPFSLTSFRKARSWAKEIKEYTQARLMPPWKAVPEFGRFKHSRELRAEDIALIARWVDAGAPQGDASLLPPPPRFNDSWVLGEPDHIVEMPEEYRIAPEGEDDYRHFVIPTDFDKDMFVEAIDVQPGNRQTVHHVIVFVDTSGKARELDAEDPGPGYTRFGDVGFEAASALGGWAPGSRPEVAPPRTGRWLPKGGDIVLQVHYYRTGAWERDRTRVGLYFSKHPKPIAIRTGVVINQKFEIPPGEARHEVRAALTLEEPMYAVSVFPHMHLLGTEMKVTAALPDGKIRKMIWIKNWDFNWQQSYVFEKLLYLPAGTEIRVVAYFDNSSKNPNNPHDPPKPVGWGEKTTDEMCIAFVDFVKSSEYKPASNEILGEPIAAGGD